MFDWLTALLLLVVVVHLEHDVRVEVLASDGQSSFLKLHVGRWEHSHMMSAMVKGIRVPHKQISALRTHGKGGVGGQEFEDSADVMSEWPKTGGRPPYL